MTNLDQTDFENTIKSEIQLVTFKIHNEIYGIDVMKVQEVLRVSDISPVPGTPHYVLGIINLRGNVVTVIDTCQRFGLKSSELTNETRIIVTESDDQVVGMLVDKVAEVAYVKNSKIDPPPNIETKDNSRYIQGVVNLEDSLLIVMDIEKFMTDESLDLGI